jgi:phosphopantothenoylcysteine decarboxylase/phosphopantothenate--cysteine ligase
MTDSKNVLVGVTGGIAAYKACDLVRELVRDGHRVIPVLTQAATRFVTPLTFSALAGERARHDMWDEREPEAIEHIALGRWADAVIVAPASLDFIGRLANGLAGELLLAILLALPREKNVLIAPAMNTRMWEHPLFLRNLERLSALNEQGYRYHFISPVDKLLACGEEGAGGLAPTEQILERAREILSSTARLVSKPKEIS